MCNLPIWYLASMNSKKSLFAFFKSTKMYISCLLRRGVRHQKVNYFTEIKPSNSEHRSPFLYVLPPKQQHVRKTKHKRKNSAAKRMRNYCAFNWAERKIFVESWVQCAWVFRRYSHRLSQCVTSILLQLHFICKSYLLMACHLEGVYTAKAG